MSASVIPASPTPQPPVPARHGSGRQPERATLVHEWFEAQAVRTPEAIAVECGSNRLTYRELNEKANALALRLRALQARPNTAVGICLERSLELVVAIYGVLKSGGYYVPLDPAYPSAHLAYMLESVHAPVVIGSAAQAALLRSRASHFIASEDLLRAEGIPQNPSKVNEPGDLLYTIFTSGSTGRPKGAAVYHRGFLNLLNWFVSDFAIGAEDRSLLISSFSFDLTQKNFFAVLSRGGSLHLLAPGPYDPGAIAQAIESQSITLLNCTPSAFYPLIESAAADALDRLRTLRCLFLGGEAISAQRLGKWTASPAFRAEIVNTYGPTECTDICAFHRLTEADLAGVHPVPLGRPIDNTSLAVMNENFEECGVGVTGELWVAGAGVGAGYITDPELTREKFLRNPAPAVLPGTTIYRTGDLARWRADGTLEFAGRADHQVKIRGFRIELGEIESVLEQHPSVRSAAVTAHYAEEGGSASLAAYFVREPGTDGSVDTLRAFVRGRLPEHMVPAFFQELTKMPLSPNGKVDRRALPAPAAQVVSAVEVPVASTVPTPVAATIESLEVRVAAVWSEVLRLPEVGSTQNFFDIGGDSLLLIEVHNRLNRVLAEGPVSVTALFQYSTIESFCAHLREQQPVAAGGNAPVSAGASALEERARKQRAALRRPGNGFPAVPVNGKEKLA